MKKIIKQKGATMVEFAMVLPIFLVLVFGVIEFSLMFYDKAMITNASREIARSGIALRSPALTAAQLSTLATTTNCKYVGGNSATCPNNPNNLLISFGTNTPATATAVYNPSYPPASGTTTVTATVSYTYHTLVIGALLNLIHGSFSPTVAMSATSTMNSE